MEDEPTRADSPRAPVVVLAAAFGLLALALVVIVVRPSTAPEPQPPEPTGRPPVTTPPAQSAPGSQRSGTDDGGDRPETTSLPAVDEIRSLMAEGFEEDYDPHVTRGEADCLAEAVLDVLGPDRLLRLTEAMVTATTDDGGDAEDDLLITPDEERRLDREMRPCVDDETATRLDL